MPQVAERQVPGSILSDDQRGPLPKRASVVVAAKDQALVGCNRFQLLPGKWRELERSRFAFLVTKPGKFKGTPDRPYGRVTGLRPARDDCRARTLAV